MVGVQIFLKIKSLFLSVVKSFSIVLTLGASWMSCILQDNKSWPDNFTDFLKKIEDIHNCFSSIISGYTPFAKKTHFGPQGLYLRPQSLPYNEIQVIISNGDYNIRNIVSICGMTFNRGSEGKLKKVVISKQNHYNIHVHMHMKTIQHVSLIWNLEFL